MIELFTQTLVNLTPHAIRVRGMDGAVSTTDCTIQPSGDIARVQVSQEIVGHVNGLPILKSVVGEVVGLPAASPNTVYIVSMVVRTSVPNRDDVFSPGTLLRDSAGQPVGCVGLVGN